MERDLEFRRTQEQSRAEAKWVYVGSRSFWSAYLNATKWRAKPLAKRSIYAAIERITPLRKKVLDQKIADALKNKEAVVVSYSGGRIVLKPRTILDGEPWGTLMNVSDDLSKKLTTGEEDEVSAVYGKLGLDIDTNDYSGEIETIKVTAGKITLRLDYDWGNGQFPTIYKVAQTDRFDQFITTYLLADLRFRKNTKLVLKRTA